MLRVLVIVALLLALLLWWTCLLLCWWCRRSHHYNFMANNTPKKGLQPRFPALAYLFLSTGVYGARAVMVMGLKTFLSKEELAEALCVCPNTIEKLVKAGELPPARMWQSIRSGGIWIGSEVEAAVHRLPAAEVKLVRPLECPKL